MSDSKLTTTIQVYIEPDYMENSTLSTLVEVDVDVFELSESDVIPYLFNLVQPKLKGTELGKKFGIQSIREYVPTPKVPTPPWLEYPELKNMVIGHKECFGDLDIYQWGFFIRTLLSEHWKVGNNWILNKDGFGYPDIEKLIPTSKYYIKRIMSNEIDNIPSGWIYHKNDNISYLRIGANPFEYHLDSHQFLTINDAASLLLSPQTHPVFYYSLYLFWEYLEKQPLWFTCSYTLQQFNDVNANSSVSWYRLGSKAYRERYAFYSILKSIFYKNSFALHKLDEQRKLYNPNQTSSVLQNSGFHQHPRLDQDQEDDTLYKVPPRHRILSRHLN